MGACRMHPSSEFHPILVFVVRVVRPFAIFLCLTGFVFILQGCCSGLFLYLKIFSDFSVFVSCNPVTCIYINIITKLHTQHHKRKISTLDIASRMSVVACQSLSIEVKYWAPIKHPVTEAIVKGVKHKAQPISAIIYRLSFPSDLFLRYWKIYNTINNVKLHVMYNLAIKYNTKKSRTNRTLNKNYISFWALSFFWLPLTLFISKTTRARPNLWNIDAWNFIRN